MLGKQASSFNSRQWELVRVSAEHQGEVRECPPVDGGLQGDWRCWGVGVDCNGGNKSGALQLLE